MPEASKLKIGTIIYNVKDAVARKVMKGAGANAVGEAGQVPAPPAGAQSKYLRGDGTWQTPPDTNTTYGAATQSAAGLMSAADKQKLDGVAANANNFTYSHPTTHPASMITQDATHRFVTDSEKTTWNGKAGTGTVSQSANGLMSANDKKKLDGIAANANNYSHPSGNGNNHIPSGGASGQILRWSAAGTAAWGSDNNTTYGAATQSANGLMSANDKKKLDGIANNANNFTYSHPSSHPASMIAQDGTHRFVTDSEKATWNAAPRMIYTGWGKSLTIPLGRGIHGIILDDWRWVYGVCVQGNAGSRSANIEYANEYWNKDMEEPDITVSYNNTTNVMTVTRKDGANNSLIYIGV